jgi:hypothetical protein
MKAVDERRTAVRESHLVDVVTFANKLHQCLTDYGVGSVEWKNVLRLGDLDRAFSFVSWVAPEIYDRHCRRSHE